MHACCRAPLALTSLATPAPARLSSANCSPQGSLTSSTRIGAQLHATLIQCGTGASSAGRRGAQGSPEPVLSSRSINSNKKALQHQTHIACKASPEETAAAGEGKPPGGEGSAAGMPAQATQQQQQQQQHAQGSSVGAVLWRINDATKWAVSAAAFTTLLLRRDLAVAWCLVGSITAAMLCKALKFAINQSRPEGARKADPGMPSSHANSLAFLSTYVSLASAASAGLAAAPASASAAGAAAAVTTVPGLLMSASPLTLLLVLGVPAGAIFLAWLRVALGFHTVPQVVVGWLVGSGTAACWHAWGRSVVMPRITQDLALQGCLWAMTAAAVAMFAWQNVRRWFHEHGHQAAPAAAAAKDA